jgi:hypothetical protein
VTDRAVALVLTDSGEDCRDAGARLFPGMPLEDLARERLRPPAPFDGRLFELLSAQPRGCTVALVIPVLAAWRPAVTRPAPVGRTASLTAGDCVPIGDHVSLEARGPLIGRWPAGVSRDFPSMTGIYQPAGVRPRDGARVYSSGVVVAGVADARRLTRFEARAVREGGWPIVSDSLVPVAVVAAYYGLKLAACGLVQAPRSERE